MESKSRDLLVLQLLKTLHLNVFERKIFVDNPIRFMEVVNCIQNQLNQNSTFPITGLVGESFEGIYIVKNDNSDFELVWQRNNPLNPFKTVERISKKYKDSNKLIFDYLEKGYNFNIDGIQISK